MQNTNVNKTERKNEKMKILRKHQHDFKTVIKSETVHNGKTVVSSIFLPENSVFLASQNTLRGLQSSGSCYPVCNGGVA